MARDYAVVKAALAGKTKWIDLSWSAKAGWFVLFLNSITTEGFYDSRAQAERILKRDGCRRGANLVIDELGQRRFLDELPDGRLYMHDWKDHQLRYRAPSDTPEATRERKRRSRDRSRKDANVTGVTNSHGGVVTGADSGADSPREMSRGVTRRHDKGKERRDSSFVVSKETPHSASDARANGAAPVFHLVEELADRPFSYSPGSRVFQTLMDDIKQLGPDRVMAELRTWRSDRVGPVDVGQLVWGAHNSLYPLDGPRVAAAPTEQERNRQEAQRLLAEKRAQKGNHKLGGSIDA